MTRVLRRVWGHELSACPTETHDGFLRLLGLENLDIARTELFQDRDFACHWRAGQTVHLSTVHVIEDDRRASLSGGCSEDKVIEVKVSDVANVESRCWEHAEHACFGIGVLFLRYRRDDRFGAYRKHVLDLDVGE